MFKTNKIISMNLRLFFVFLGHSQEDMWRIRKAISEATSLEEVEHLTKLLQSGQIPNKKSNTQNGGNNK